MEIKIAKYLKSVTGTNDILYDGKLQVAFMGRSNVGKSSLINSLTQRNNLARTSSSPGKTVKMDFFLINDSFYFVDFPGYGFAKRSHEQRDKLAKMILWYITYSEIKNRLVILIVDAKVGITDFDEEIIKFLKKSAVNFILIANKIDNIKANQRQNQIEQILRSSKSPEVIAYSSKEKIGRNQLLGKISTQMII